MVKGMKKIGSRTQVMNGTEEKTSYGKSGLRKSDLKYNKQGKIVSKKMSERAKREKRLVNAGYETKKGVFGAFKNGKKISKRRSSKRRSSKRRSSKRRSRRRRSKRRQGGGATPNASLISQGGSSIASLPGTTNLSNTETLDTIKNQAVAIDESGGALGALD